MKTGIAVNDVLSEVSHYRVIGINADDSIRVVPSAKARARQRGETFTIDIEDIVVPEACPILGMPLKYNRGMKGDDSYSLDRIDSSKGYVKGNIWVISLRANRIKNDSTVEELRLIADKVEQKLKEAR